MALAVDDTKDGIRFTGARTANTISFVLLGGKYSYGFTAPSTSVVVNIIMPDASALPLFTALAAAGIGTLDLPPGSYQVVLVATGDVAGYVQKVPYNPAY